MVYAAETCWNLTFLQRFRVTIATLDIRCFCAFHTFTQCRILHEIANVKNLPFSKIWQHNWIMATHFNINDIHCTPEDYKLFTNVFGKEIINSLNKMFISWYITNHKLKHKASIYHACIKDPMTYVKNNNNNNLKLGWTIYYKHNNTGVKLFIEINFPLFINKIKPRDKKYFLHNMHIPLLKDKKDVIYDMEISGSVLLVSNYQHFIQLKFDGNQIKHSVFITTKHLVCLPSL